MNVHQFERKGLMADYARSGAGVVLFGVPLAMTSGGWATVLLGAVWLVFAWYGVRPALRGRSHVEIGEPGIAVVGPFGRRIAWGDLSSVELRYYSTSKEGRGGWMQLTLKGGGTTIKFDSTLDRFKDVVEYVIREAERRGIDLSPTTISNLEPLGIRVQERS